MDEFDEFAAEGEGGTDGFDDAAMDDAAMGDDSPSSEFDEFDDAEVPGEADLESFAYDYGEDGLEAGIDDAFDVEADFDDEPGEAEPDETAYASTYEDVLVAEADNPAAFPPELDMDVPEPVDGYPWVDLDTLGSAEAEPWVNTVEASDYAAADLDDVASEALARFWD